MYRLEEETEADWWEAEALYDLCFAPGRPALSSYRLRDGVPTVAPLCLTLRDDDNTLAAVIRYWPALIGEHDVLLLGPIAVHPTRQGEGLGALLINESLAEARRLGWERVMLVGEARRVDFDAMSQAAMKRQQQARGSAYQPVLELLRWDLANARSLRQDNQQLGLEGFAWLDEQTLEARL